MTSPGFTELQRTSARIPHAHCGIIGSKSFRNTIFVGKPMIPKTGKATSINNWIPHSQKHGFNRKSLVSKHIIIFGY